MRIPELPASIAILGGPREKTPLIHPSPCRAHLDFMVRSSHHREIRCHRIDAQIVTPLELDALDQARQIPDSHGGGGAVPER